MSMSISTNALSILGRKWTEHDGDTFKKSSRKLAYSKRIGETDSIDMKKIRTQLLHAIEQNQSNVDDLISEFEALKENEFIIKHGMSSLNYKKQQEREQFLRETVEARTCFCTKCKRPFESDRLYPNCTHCDDYRQLATEKIVASEMIGKQIKEVYRNEYETILVFTDNSTSILDGWNHDE